MLCETPRLHEASQNARLIFEPSGSSGASNVAGLRDIGSSFSS